MYIGSVKRAFLLRACKKVLEKSLLFLAVGKIPIWLFCRNGLFLQKEDLSVKNTSFCKKTLSSVNITGQVLSFKHDNFPKKCKQITSFPCRKRLFRYWYTMVGWTNPVQSNCNPKIIQYQFNPSRIQVESKQNPTSVQYKYNHKRIQYQSNPR